jgi:hypothetical protein
MLHAYEIRPRKDKRGVNLISDALPFGRLWYGEPNAAGQRKSAFGAPDQGNSTRIADSISGKARRFSDSQSELPFPL